MFSIIKQIFPKKTFLVLIMLFSFYPYVFCNILQINLEPIFLMIYILLFLFFIYRQREKVYRFPVFLKLTMLIQAITWIFYFIIHGDGSYVIRVLFIILTYLALSTLLFDGTIARFARTYNGIICTMAVAGIPIFFLFAFVGIEPLFTFYNIDAREAGFFGVTCSNAYTSGLLRVAGFFDEPGAFAFWGIYALIINKLFFKNRIVEIGLVVGLLFTLSAAYFIQLFLYVLFFCIRSMRQLFIIVLMSGICAISLYRVLGDNAYFAYMTIERFNGGEVRSSRVDLTHETKKIFKQSPVVGIGAKELQEIGYFDDNPYEIPAKDGIIGFFVTYLPLFLLLKRYVRGNIDLLMGILILFAGYMQRPFHINELHFFMLYLFAVLAYHKYKNGKSKEYYA